jgi:hypothetical protein
MGAEVTPHRAGSLSRDRELLDGFERGQNRELRMGGYVICRRAARL